MSFYFGAFPVSYQQCADCGSLAYKEIERVQFYVKDLLYVFLRSPSNYYHQPVLTSLWRLVENFSHHLPSLRPATVYIFL